MATGTFIVKKIPWPQGGTTLKASAAVTAAGTSTAVKVGKGLFYLAFDVTAIANATGEALRVEVQFNKKSNATLSTQSKIVWDGDFVTANTIIVTVDGTAAATVTFATDHATTAALVVAAVQALTGITCELDVSDTNSRTIFIYKTAKTAIGTVTEVVALGAGAASGTVTYDGDWYTSGAPIHYGDAIQGDPLDAVQEIGVIFENPYDYQVRLKYSIVSTPSVTFSVVAHALNSRKTT